MVFKKRIISETNGGKTSAVEETIRIMSKIYTKIMLRTLGRCSFFSNLVTAGLRATIRINDRKSKMIIFPVKEINLIIPSIAAVKITIEGEIIIWVLFLEENKSDILRIV